MKPSPPKTFNMPLRCRPDNFWDRRGKKLVFNNAEELWETACEYFTYVQENPLYEAKSYSYQGRVHQDRIKKMRAMTLDGFCLFANICNTTWYTYEGRKGFQDTIERIKRVIRTQKFEGAAAGLLNPIIIIRDLGLRDTVDTTNLNAEMKYTDLTDEEIDAKLKAKMHEFSNIKQI